MPTVSRTDKILALVRECPKCNRQSKLHIDECIKCGASLKRAQWKRVEVTNDSVRVVDTTDAVQ